MLHSTKFGLWHYLVRREQAHHVQQAGPHTRVLEMPFHRGTGIVQAQSHDPPEIGRDQSAEGVSHCGQPPSRFGRRTGQHRSTGTNLDVDGAGVGQAEQALAVVQTQPRRQIVALEQTDVIDPAGQRLRRLDLDRPIAQAPGRDDPADSRESRAATEATT